MLPILFDWASNPMVGRGRGRFTKQIAKRVVDLEAGQAPQLGLVFWAFIVASDTWA